MRSIQELKDHHKKELSMYEDNKKSYINSYGSKWSEYLIHQCRMHDYHMGCLDAIEVIESIK